jgi:hypothetical protein
MMLRVFAERKLPVERLPNFNARGLVSVLTAADFFLRFSVSDIDKYENQILYEKLNALKAVPTPGTSGRSKSI